MSPQPATVSAEFVLSLVVPGSTCLPVAAQVRYEARDPFAVHVAFDTGDEEAVEWTFARSLLTEGVSGPAGEGDVQVWPTRSPAGPVVCLTLSSPSGRAMFEIAASDLVEFLAATYAAVPIGSEPDFLDMDAELAMLLWDGPSAAC